MESRMKKIIFFIICLCFFMLGACGTLDRLEAWLLPEPEVMLTEDEDYDFELPPILRDDAPYSVVDNILRLPMRHPLTLNPLLNEDITVAPILRLMFEPLITISDDFRAVSHLTEIELASDYSSAFLTIVSGAIWNDGAPVVSDDIVFSIQALKNAPEYVIYKANVSNISEVRRINERSVQVFFTQPSLHASLALNIPIIPRHIYQGQQTLRSARNMLPVGNGPFMFESITPMWSLNLMRNPYSFRTPAYIDAIEVVFLSDEQTMIHAFDQGRVDVINMPLTDWVRHHSVRPIRHENVPAMYFEFVGFNFDNELFHDTLFRRAVAQAVDFDAAIASIYLDQAVRAISPIHPMYWASSHQSGLDFNPNMVYHTLNIEQYEPLVVLVNDDNRQRVAIAQRLAQSLTAIGLHTVVHHVPLEDYFYRLHGGSFDFFVGGTQLGMIPDFTFLFNGEGLFMQDTTLEANFDAIKNASTRSMYMQSIATFEANFMNHVPIIPLVFRHSSVLTTMRIAPGIEPAPDFIYANIVYWQFN